MNKNVFLLLCISLFLISFVSAEVVQTDDYFKMNSPIHYNKQCYNNGTYCATGTACNLTVFSQNGSLILSNVQMTNQIYTYNYTIPSINKTGIYQAGITCTDGILSGSKGYTFYITPNGREPAGEFLTVVIYLLFAVFTLTLAYFFIVNIGKLATATETLYDVAYSWGVYFGLLIFYWLAANFAMEEMILDFAGLYLTITAFTNVLIPMFALIITMFWKISKKNKNPYFT